MYQGTSEVDTSDPDDVVGTQTQMKRMMQFFRKLTSHEMRVDVKIAASEKQICHLRGVALYATHVKRVAALSVATRNRLTLQARSLCWSFGLEAMGSVALVPDWTLPIRRLRQKTLYEHIPG